MSTMKHIRTSVFEVSQGEFAKVAGVRQATVSKWEAGLLLPDIETMKSIRNEAIERGLEWRDAWFFELPSEDASEKTERTDVTA